MFTNQLMSYFGDRGDSVAIPDLKADLPDYPYVVQVFREGLAYVLADADFDRMRLVSDCANRRARTDEEARAWLKMLQNKLFPEG
jgi:hypothetical protein